MRWKCLGFFLALCAARVAAAAEISLVPNRGSLPGAQTVTWSQLGPAGTLLPQPFQISSDAGFPITVYKNNSPTPYIRADEGNGFRGDFAPAEPLLFSTSLTAIDVVFSQPVWGVGANLQREAVPVPPVEWLPYIRVKRTDGPDVTFVLPTDINDAIEDGSAPFVGVISTAPTITEVLFDSFRGGNTAINHLSIMVPEPTVTGAALLAAMAASRRMARRHRRRP